MYPENSDQKTAITALSLTLLLAAMIGFAGSVFITSHNCSIEGHECEVTETVKIVEKPVSIADIATNTTTIERAIIVELDSRIRQGKSVSYRNELLDRLNKIQQDKITRAQNLFQPSIKRLTAESRHLEAKTRKLEAEAAHSELREKWASLELSKQEKILSDLQEIKNIKVEIEEIELEIGALPSPPARTFNSARERWRDLKVREAEYFAR